jgi:hypothetical protein
VNGVATLEGWKTLTGSTQFTVFFKAKREGAHGAGNGTIDIKLYGDKTETNFSESKLGVACSANIANTSMSDTPTSFSFEKFMEPTIPLLNDTWGPIKLKLKAKNTYPTTTSS